MKANKFTLFALFLVCFSTNLSAQYITVNDSYSAQQLIQDVLINSPCANVENFTVSGDPFSTGEQSYGFFNGNSSSFPFSNGIILCTARANRAPGPNNNLIDEGSTNWHGDPDLEQALGISNTLNATVLEFDFTPLTNQVSFDYLFASEEYQGTAPCHYSDGFAFLLKEAGSSNAYTNLAIIPNTNTPVLVTSVHPDISGDCPAQNEAYFGGYNDSNAPINFNGQTVVLTAKSVVTPNVKYHIKLVIADHENIRYDSAIFLGGGSFKVGADLGPDRLVSSGNPVCYGEAYTLNTNPVQPDTNTYKWYKNNILLSSETNSSYTVTLPGTYKVEIALGASACIAESEVRIEYGQALNPTPSTIVQCDEDNDGTTVFNLHKADNLIVANDSALQSPVYYENISDANAIENEDSYTALAPKTVYAKVSNAYGCTAFTEVYLTVSNNSVTPPAPIATCDQDDVQDGLYHFDLDAEVTPQITATLPAGLSISYFANANDALTEENTLPNIFENTMQQQIIWARIVNGPDCYGVIPITLKVNTFTAPGFEDEESLLCDGTVIPLSVASGYAGYLWDDPDHSATNSIMVGTPGTYTVTVSDTNGCTVTKKFIVKPSGIATIIAVEVKDFLGGQNMVTVNVSGTGDYEYALYGETFQDDPVFNNVLSGTYTVLVNDKNGCGQAEQDLFVLDYPKFFTPNNDSFNDIWQIPFLEQFYPSAKVAIFDRYGKLIYSFIGNGPGWNGKLNSRPLPSTDYWFVITLDDKRTVRGHFALKR
jgi:gliding motility-associated-like protein